MAKVKKSKVPFIVALSLLILAIVIPVILLFVSTILGREADDKLNKSLYPVLYEDLVEKAAKEYQVDIALIYGIIRTESNFDPDALSQAGAIGLMQIMPDTFTWLQNYRTDFMPEEILDSSNLYKPEINIDYGVFLLSYLLEHYEGNVSLVICSYNAGYGNVDDWLADGTLNEASVKAEDVPFPETSNYLTKVTNAMGMYRELYFAENVYGKKSYGDSSSEAGSVYDTSGEFLQDDYQSYVSSEAYYNDYQNGYIDDENYYNDDNYAYQEDYY